MSRVPIGADGRPTEPWDGGEQHARELHEAKRTLAALEEEWLSGGGGIPTLSE